MKRKKAKKRAQRETPLAAPTKWFELLDRVKQCERSMADQERIREAVGHWIVARRLVRHAQQKMQEAADNLDGVVLAVLHRQEASVSPWTGTSTAGAASVITTDTANA